MRKKSRLLSSLIVATVLLSGFEKPVDARAANPGFYPCDKYTPGCVYLVERVNYFRRNKTAYCKSRWGRDASVLWIRWIIPFCTLPYNPHARPHL